MRLRVHGRSPDAIADELRGEPNAPTGRTIRNWIARGWVSKPVRPSDPWSLMHGRPEDVPLVLPVLEVVARLPRAAQWLSIEEAEAVARIRRAVPEVKPAAALTLAILYVSRKGKETTDLDLYLAFHPWRSEDELEAEWTKRRQRYLAIAETARVEAIGVSGTHPGQAYSWIDGTSLINEED